MRGGAWGTPGFRRPPAAAHPPSPSDLLRGPACRSHEPSHSEMHKFTLLHFLLYFFTFWVHIWPSTSGGDP